MIGIIGAMAEEVEILKDSIVDMEEKVYYGHTFYQGLLQNQSCVVVQSGIGKVNASIVIPLLKMYFDVKIIINTGSAGALDSALKIGDIVIAHSLTYHDVDVTHFGYQYGQMAGMPEIYYPDSSLVRQAQEACRKINIEPYIGLITSGDSFIGTNIQKQTILDLIPRARACEMESTAIAQTCYRMDIPFVIIRSISDTANDEASLSFDQFLHIASRASATIVLQLLEDLKL